MPSPILQIIPKHKPFTYFHTHVVDRNVLNAAITAKKSLELDISITEEGTIYIGHPLPMYKFFNMPPPNNLPLDTVLKESKAAGLFLMFDCKDVRVLPTVQKKILEYGIENCILHCCTKALLFQPFAKKIIVEPHWNRERIALDPILAVKRATNVPLALCCMGLSDELIQKLGETTVLKRLLEVAEGNAEVVVLAMPKDELPPLSIMEKLLERGILSLFNIDHTPPEKRPPIFLGSTDVLTRATDPKDLN